MENWLIASLPILGKTLLSVLVIFTIIIIIAKLAGLRTFAKMSSFDFASTIAIGSILASVVLDGGQSLAKGTVALAGVVAFQYFFSVLARKNAKFRDFFTNSPMLLMKDGEILYENLSKTNVGESELLAKLREANAFKLSEVKAVVLESTGDISVLHTESDKEIEDFLLKGVRRE